MGGESPTKPDPTRSSRDDIMKPYKNRRGAGKHRTVGIDGSAYNIERSNRDCALLAGWAYTIRTFVQA